MTVSRITINKNKAYYKKLKEQGEKYMPSMLILKSGKMKNMYF